MPKLVVKTTLDATIYHRGMYYKRFVCVVPATEYLDGLVGYHTCPSTPGVTWGAGEFVLNGLGSTQLKPIRSYRPL